MNRWLPRLLALLVSTACSSGAGDVSDSDRALEIHTWWIHPGEKPALDVLLNRFGTQYPNTNVVRTTANTQAALPPRLEALFTDGSPPDTFQTVGGGDLLRWVLYNGVNEDDSLLEPVNAAAEASGLVSALPRVVRDALGVDDRLYAIPLDVPRVNTLFYNVQLLSGNQLSPPTTLDEFFAVAEALKAKNITPLALGSKDGAAVAQMLFDGTLIAEGGVAFRDAYLSGEEDPSDQRLVNAVSKLGRMLEYTNADHDNLDWPQAARLLIDGSAAMIVTGDWAKTFLTTETFKPGVHFGQVVFPDTQGVFAFLVDGFTLPRSAANRASAVNFLKLISSRDAANVFSPLKGTMAARLDVDRTSYDALTQQTATEFRSAMLTLGHRAKISNLAFLTYVDATLRQFAFDHDAAPVLNALVHRYGQL